MKRILKNLYQYSEILMSCLINNYTKNDSEESIHVCEKLNHLK